MDRTFFDYIRLSGLSRLRTIVLYCLLAWVGVVVAVRSAETQYLARVDVMVSTSTDSILPGSAALGPLGAMAGIERETFIASQELIVRSRALFARVEAELAQERSPGSGAPPSRLARLLASVQTLLFGAEYVETSTRYRDLAYAGFLRNVSFTPQFDTGSFVIGYRDADPAEAIRTAGAIAQGVIEINSEHVREQTAKASDFLRRKVTEAADGVEASSERLAGFMKQHRYIDSGTAVDARFRQYLDADAAHRLATIEVLTTERLLADGTRLQTSVEKELRGVLGDGEHARIEALLGEIHRFEAGLLATGTDPSGPLNAQLSGRLQSLRRQLSAEVGARGSLLDAKSLQEILRETRRRNAELQSGLAAARVKADGLAAQARRAAAEVENYPELHARFTRMMAEHLQKTKILEQLTESLQKVALQSDAKPANLLMLDRPMISSNLLSTGKLRMLVIGFGLATALIVLGFASLDFARGTIFTLSHLAESQGDAVLGYFPHVRRRSSDLVRASARNPHVQRLAHMIDHRLSRRSDDAARVVLMSSAASGSGKSTSAIGVAAGLAGAEHRVLVVDCDFRARKRGIRHYLRREDGGAAAALFDLQTQHDAIVAAAAEAPRGPVFAALDAAPGAEEELERFLRSEFRERLERYRGCFDYIVLDGPPLSFAEGLFLLAHADAVLVCCRQGRATESEVGSSLGLVEQYKADAASAMLLLTDARLHGAGVSTVNYRRPGANYPRAA